MSKVNQSDYVTSLVSAAVQGNGNSKQDVILDYALVQAIQQGDVQAARTCIRYGANVHFQDPHNNTPIILASQNKFSCSFDMVDMLLDAGANPNDANMDDWTPLHYAAKNGDLYILQVLHEYGAKVSAYDKRGRTPLIVAVSNGQQEAVHHLIQMQALVHQTDKNGVTPLMVAVEQSDVEMVNILLKYGARMHMEDAQGRTALRIAVLHRDLPVVSALYIHDCGDTRKELES
jgi:ankyrin repeat protein